MTFIIGFLTVILVLDCLVLILLVLIQLPKKEAGAGLAFGGAATDALFGAGSGNVLTKDKLDIFDADQQYWKSFWVQGQ